MLGLLLAGVVVGSGLIPLLIHLLIFVLIVALVYWIINLPELPLPGVVRRVLNVGLAVIAVVVIILFLMSLL